tara:strand:+ start:82 stop:585 length:504 start_codon:yes stop_codon:yes gene_type:complete
MNRIALYPGTFDPVTNGHLDIMKRACKICDTLIIAVAENDEKKPLFNIKKRIDLINEAVASSEKLKKQTDSIKVKSFNNLLIEFAKINSVSMIIRGLRAVSDFDYEFQMAGMNSRLNSNIETIFLMASETNQFVASRFVKEVASFGGDVSSFVPPNVYQAIKKKYNS